MTKARVAVVGWKQTFFGLYEIHLITKNIIMGLCLHE